MTRRPVGPTWPRPRRRRSVVALGAAGLLGSLLAACGPGPTAGGPDRLVRVTGGPRPVPAPVNCPGPTYAPGAPYDLTVSGTITGSLSIRHNANNQYPSIVPDIRARFCGTLAVPGETGSVPAAQITFAPAHLYLGYHLNKKGHASFVQEYDLTLIPVGTATATVLRLPTPDGAAPGGGLELRLDTEVTTIVALSTARCIDGPVNLSLTSQAPGGEPLTGPLTAAQAVVAQQGFTLPAVQPQASCNLGGIPYDQTLNATLYLPATDTDTTEAFGVHVAN